MKAVLPLLLILSACGYCDDIIGENPQERMINKARAAVLGSDTNLESYEKSIVQKEAPRFWAA